MKLPEILAAGSPKNPDQILPVKKKSIAKLALWTAAIGLTSLHAYLFTFGYRLTADDVYFHYGLMEGVTNVIDVAKRSAIKQGRIGNFVTVPLMAIGSYFTDYYVFRVFYAAVYFINFLLVARFASLLVGSEITLPVFAVMLSLNPLDYSHFPPNSYPLLVTIPSLIVIVSRLWLWRVREAGSRASPVLEICLLIVCAGAMLVYEQVFVFAIGLMACEYISRLSTQYSKNQKLSASLAATFRRSTFGADIVMAALALLVYLAFRAIFTSSYNGNKADGWANFHDFIMTLFGHIYYGASISSFSSRGVRSVLGLQNSPVSLFLTAMGVGILTFGVVFFSTQLAKKVRAPGLVISSSILFSALITIPVAATLKYQQWCLAGSCSYIDSRVSYYGVAVAVGALIFLVIDQAYSQRRKLLLRAVMSGGIGVLSALTYLDNWHVAQSMRLYVAGWERATALACASDLTQKPDDKLIKLIDPAGLISFHLNFPMGAYWRKYIENRARNLDCNDLSGAQTNLLTAMRNTNLIVQMGSKVSFLDPANVKFLKSGWWRMEPWGVWSDGETSQVELDLQKLPENDLMLFIEGHAFLADKHPSQEIDVLVNEKYLATLRYQRHNMGKRHLYLSYEPTPLLKNLFNIAGGELEREDIRTVMIPKDLALEAEGRLSITFNYKNSVSPKELGLSSDSQRRGFALVSLKLE